MDQGYSPIKYPLKELNGIPKRLHAGVTLQAFPV